MKILILSDANSIHTIRWAKSLSKNNILIKIFSLNNYDRNIYKEFSNISICNLNFSKEFSNKSDGNLFKSSYLSSVSKLKSVIKEFKPDILHAHYASSYGLLGSLTGFHPFIISVWGSDIFDFPHITIFHKGLIKFNLSKADKILSTSHVMAKETQKYTKDEIIVTPFGVDLNKFRKKKVTSIFSNEDIVIGTVKKLSSKYGIDYLINSFSLLKKNNSDLPLKLLIVGAGEDSYKLKKLCNDLLIAEDVVFTGFVDNSIVPDYLNMIDVYVALSISDSESFGVAIVEASACEIPVVVSNVGGLPEVVDDTITGFVVKSKNSQEAAKAIEKLTLNKELRLKMGKAGRERVKELYNWEENVNQMINIYKSIVK